MKYLSSLHVWVREVRRERERERERVSEREREREILLAYLSNTYQVVFTEPQRERERQRE